MKVVEFPFQIYLSNQVEQLYSQLKRELFQEGLPPFSRKIILVPSPAMKSWLMVRMADDPDIGIAAGLEFTYLDEGIQRLLRLFTGASLLPAKLDLALMLEWEMVKALREGWHPPWDPLRQYVKCMPGTALTGRSRRRLAGLAETLADLFLQYGKFGGKMTDGWEAQPQADWQEALWRSLAKLRKPLSKCLEAPFLPDIPQDVSVHLFSISFLPAPYHRFLARLSPRAPLRQYILSPCALFWSDIQGDKEARRLVRFWRGRGASEAQLEKLDHYLKDRNPLLANFGRLGREAALQVESSDAIVHELYRIDDSANTLLTKIQQDLLTLRNPDETGKECVAEDDRTVQVHAAPSPLREVQVIYDLIIGLIEEHKGEEDPIKPSDIVVMAPDIMKYEPYVRMVFSHPGSLLEAQIHDLQMPALSPFAQAFMQLISLVATRWEPEDLLNLIDLPPFRDKQGWGHEEAVLIRTWVKKAGIRWGVDRAHRFEVLERSLSGNANPEMAGTWEFGLGSLMRGLVSAEGNEEGVGLPDVKLLGELLKLLRGLRRDLSPLTGGERKAAEWTAILQALMRDYLDVENHEYQETKALMDRILATIAETTKATPDAYFPFSSIRRHLEAAMGKESTSFRESQLQAVRFCSLLPMRTIPSKVVVLMGMDENAYPRRENHLSLDRLKGSADADYAPSQADFDRYLFLEGLLSARRYFILTYSDTDSKDFKDQAPSLLVTELLDYVDHAFETGGERTSNKIKHRHPFRAYDKSYFVEGAPFPVYSKSRYREAIAFYSKEKQPIPSFIPHFPKEGRADEKPTEISVDIKELKSFCSNSLRSYFKRGLGIYLPSDEDGEFSDADKLSLNHLEMHKVKSALLRHPAGLVVGGWESQGKLPGGVLGAIACDKIREEEAKLEKLISGPERKGVTLTFTPHCRIPEQDGEGNWRLPTWNVTLTNGAIMKVSGSMEGATPAGLILHQKIESKGIMKNLPTILGYLYAIKQFSLPFPPVMMETKSEKKASFVTIDPEPLMVKVLEAYLKGLSIPLPLLADWADIMKNSNSANFRDDAENELNKTHANHFNNELNWLFRAGSLPSVDEVYEENRKWMEAVVEPLLACKVDKRTGKPKGIK